MDKVFERNGALGGIAVHLTARVMAKSTGGDVLVSEAVKDIVAGSALRFEDRGRDIEGHRRPYAVAPD